MLLLAVLLVLAACLKQNGNINANNNLNNIENNNIDGDANLYSIKIYKSMSCGCCDIYSKYMESKNDFNVETVSLDDVAPIKEQYKVPAGLQSCHTSIIEDYFVEGHIPSEAIVKLIQEKPDVLGIAMSGMPSGAPGMPGGKTEPFVIYSVNKDGTYQEFMRI